jgi:hypothetical protein
MPLNAAGVTGMATSPKPRTAASRTEDCCRAVRIGRAANTTKGIHMYSKKIQRLAVLAQRSSVKAGSLCDREHRQQRQYDG